VRQQAISHLHSVSPQEKVKYLQQIGGSFHCASDKNTISWICVAIPIDNERISIFSTSVGCGEHSRVLELSFIYCMFVIFLVEEFIS